MGVFPVVGTLQVECPINKRNTKTVTFSLTMLFSPTKGWCSGYALVFSEEGPGWIPSVREYTQQKKKKKKKENLCQKS